jgi:hypothetical protein
LFSEPTINDYLDNLRWHLAKAATRARVAINQRKSEAAARGVLHSSRTYLTTAEEVRKEFEIGTERALGELKRVARTTKLDKNDLRQSTVQTLENFALEMKALLDVGGLGQRLGSAIEGDKAGFDQHLSFVSRQFDVGFFQPIEPELPQVHNAINVGSMIGSTIQQGSPAATQSVQLTLNVDLARAAIASFEKAVNEADMPSTERNEMIAEVRTINAQLSKAAPSRLIIREAGRSLRSIFEGITAGALTPPVMAVAAALWSALGLG